MTTKIYIHLGSDSKYMKELLEENSKLYQLIDNYRSKSNLVQMSNIFVEGISNRMKYLLFQFKMIMVRLKLLNIEQ